MADALIDDDKRDLGMLLGRFVTIASVLHRNDAVKLLQLHFNYLFSHRIAYTITIDENVARHGVVELPVGCKRALEVVRKDRRRDDFLALDWLRAGLGVVLAHVWVVGSTEANSGLFSFVAHINTNEHGLLGYFRTERHSPEIAAKLGVHLADDVEENPVIVLGDGAVGNELRDNRAIAVDLVLEEGVEVLVVRVVGHYDQEYEVRVLDCTV